MAHYEWDLETWQGEGEDAECVHHQTADKLADISMPQTRHEKLVLIRNAADGTRLWAYVDETMMLPRNFTQPAPDGEYYETGVAVPKQFHREIAHFMAGRRPRATKVVTNLMSGKPVTIDADTPLCCDPSSETYWSM